jgi:hypothetical protein
MRNYLSRRTRKVKAGLFRQARPIYPTPKSQSAFHLRYLRIIYLKNQIQKAKPEIRNPKFQSTDQP